MGFPACLEMKFTFGDKTATWWLSTENGKLGLYPEPATSLLIGTYQVELDDLFGGDTTLLGVLFTLLAFGDLLELLLLDRFEASDLVKSQRKPRREATLESNSKLYP